MRPLLAAAVPIFLFLMIVTMMAAAAHNTSFGEEEEVAPPPLKKQIADNVPRGEITCRDGYVLAERPGGMLACVHGTNANRLDWGIIGRSDIPDRTFELPKARLDIRIKDVVKAVVNGTFEMSSAEPVDELGRESVRNGFARPDRYDPTVTIRYDMQGGDVRYMVMDKSDRIYVRVAPETDSILRIEFTAEFLEYVRADRDLVMLTAANTSGLESVKLYVIRYPDSMLYALFIAADVTYVTITPEYLIGW